MSYKENAFNEYYSRVEAGTSSVCCCSWCGKGIFLEDEVYDFGGKEIVCEDCIEEKKRTASIDDIEEPDWDEE